MNRRQMFRAGAGAAVIAGGATAASFLGMGNAADYAKATAAMRPALPAKPDDRALVRYATLAANGHNTQPWRFRIGESIRISPDLSRRTPAVDPDDHHLYASLGCAAENLSIAAAASGWPGVVRFEPQGQGSVVFDRVGGAPDASARALCDAIPRRQSTRLGYDGRAVAAADLATLRKACEMPGVDAVLITARPEIGRLKDLIIAGNTTQMADRAFVREFKQWMRFNPGAALKHGDGIFSGTSGNPSLPSWIGAAMFDLVFTPQSENEKYVRQLDSSSGAVVFLGEKADPAHWVQAGRACQRFALQATALGLKCSFINQPVEVAGLHDDLAALVGLPGRRPDIVMRFGYGPDVAFSPRRPVEAVLDL